MLIVVAVVVVFGRAGRFGFVMFDDEDHLVTNPYLHPFTWNSVAAFWAKPYLSLYIPATYTAWGVLSLVAARPGPDGRAVLDPATFHLANVALHATNAVLAWLILRQVIRRDGPAAVGALAFALHPLQAEPVAWASGFKDTFSGVWALLAILLFLRAHRRGTWSAYGLATLIYAIALCAKPAAVVVPPMAAAVAWAAGARPTRRAVFTLGAWVALGLACAWVTHRQQGDATIVAWNPPAVRPLVAADAVAFYLGRLLWPADLALDYGRTPRWVWQHVGTALVGVAVAGVFLIGLVWVARRRGDRHVVPAALAVFVCGIGPVLGMVPFIYQYYSTVSDRYLYLPMLGAGLLAAWAADRAGRPGRPFVIVVLATWAALAFAQVGVWRDTVTLFQHNAAINPDSGISWAMLGSSAERAGDLAAAERYHERSVTCDPDEPKYEAAVARVLARMPGRAAEARHHYALSLADAARRVLKQDPDAPLAHRGLAQAYQMLGRPGDAAVEFARAAQLKAAGHRDPSMPVAHW